MAIKNRLLSALLGAAKGYSAGVSGPVPEAGIAAGFSAGDEAAEEFAKRNIEKEKQNRIRSAIANYQASPEYATLTPRDRTAFELDPIGFMSKTQTKDEDYLDPVVASALFTSAGYKLPEGTNPKIRKNDATVLAAINNMSERRRSQQETLAERKRMAEEKRTEREGVKLEKNQQNFSGDLQKSGIPEAESILKEIEGLLPEAGKDIPGYGKTGILPDITISKRGKDLRQAVRKLMNVQLKDRSGAAVTVPELDRFKAEFGAGNLNNDEQLRIGLINAMNGIKAKAQNIYAGYQPEVKEAYREQGGQDYIGSLGGLDFNKGGQARSGKIRVSNGQETLEIDPADLQEAIKDGYTQI